MKLSRTIWARRISLLLPALLAAAPAPAQEGSLPLRLQPVRPRPAPAAAVRPAPAPSGAAERPLALEVRKAEVQRFLEQLSSSLDLPISADPALHSRRISIFAPRATLQSLRPALGSLYGGSWAAAESRLKASPVVTAAAQVLLLQRRQQFIDRVVELALRIEAGEGEAAAGAIRESVRRREPALPPEAIAEISPGYLAQALLALPLAGDMGHLLAQTGSAMAPLRLLPPAFQQLFAAFYGEQFGEAPFSQSGLTLPQARIDYRLLYGDRWTGTMLVMRAGTEDRWAEAMLPAVLFDLPEDLSIYPARQRPGGDESVLTGLVLDPNRQSWEEALALISSDQKINILTDAHLRPEVFRPGTRLPTITAANRRDLLNRAAQAYGYDWWREGDWYIFRHRRWAEEEAAAPPAELLASAASDLARTGRLSSGTLIALAALPEGQLLSLDLAGRAGSRGQADPEDFDLNRLELVRQGLLLFALLPPGQTDLARTSGIPLSLMPEAAQLRFAGIGYGRGTTPARDSVDSWRFSLRDTLVRTREPAGWSYAGEVTLLLEMGPAGRREARLSLRLPLSGSEPAEPAP